MAAETGRTARYPKRRPPLSLSWADLPLRPKGLVVVAIPLVALLVASILTYQARRADEQAEAGVQHTLTMRTQLQQVLTLLVDSETAVRGYLLTGRPAFLEPYWTARQHLPAAEARLAQLVANNPAQVERQRRLTQLVEQRLQLLDEMRSMRPLRKITAGTAPVEPLLGGKRAMDEAREHLSVMIAEEERLLAKRAERLARTETMSTWIMGGSLLFGLLGGLAAVLLFTTGVVHRVDLLERNARRLAERLPLERLPPGHDEIGRLALSLEQSSEILMRQEQELREAQLFLEHLILASPGLIVRTELSGSTTTYVSPNVERLLGYTPEEILAAPDFWMEHVHPADREGCRTMMERCPERQAAPVAMEFRFQHRDGSCRWLLGITQAEAGRNGHPASLLSYILDISDRKQAEAALQRSQVRVRELNQKLLKRAMHAEAANRELEAFSYSVSHDLRAPLRGIDGFSQALLEDYGDQLDETARGYLHRIRAGTQRMGQLIDDLLQLSRVSRAELCRQTVDLSALAESVAAGLRQQEPQRQVNFAIDAGVVVEGDRRLLQIALENLLGNAFKFSGKQEHAVIHFGVTQEGDPPACFVRDNGVGFDMAYADKLFGPFQRLHGMNEFPGTGIGLATVQRIVHRHGGRVWAEGAVGEGATFYFTLERRGDDGKQDYPSG